MKRTALTVLFILPAVHALLIFLPPLYIDAYFTLMRPLVFAACAAIFAVFSSEKNRPFPNAPLVTIVCILGALLLGGGLFVLGVFFGFGYNPAGSASEIISKNIWCFIILPVLREYLRGKVVRIFGGGGFAIAAVSLVFTFCFFDNIRAISAYRTASLFGAFLDTLVPALILNFFLTYVAAAGGSAGNMLFIGFYQSVYFISPVLPNAPKILEATIICLCVFIMYVVFDGVQWKAVRGTRPRRPYPWRSLILTASLGIAAILFVFGAFRFFPVVVVSDSMKGAFSRGDIVIIRKIDPGSAVNLAVGDIIEYRSESGIAVIHRIVRILGSGGARRYITKGDNNPVADPLAVTPDQIIGVAKWYAPYKDTLHFC